MNILSRINNSSLSPTWRFTFLMICICAPLCLLSITCGIFTNTPIYTQKIEPGIISLRPVAALFSANALWLAILLWLGVLLVNWLRLRQNYSFASLFKNSLITLVVYSSFGAAIQFGQEWLSFLSLLVLLILIWRNTIPFLKPALKQYQNKNFDQALALSNQAVQARPKNWQVYLMRASIQYELGNLSAAQSDSEQAIQLKPNEAASYATLGAILLAQSQYQPAKTAYLKAIQLNPKVVLNRLTLGRIHYRLGEYAEAIKVLQAALREKLPASIGKPIRANYCLGRSFEALNQPDQAQAAFQQMQTFRDDLKSFKEFLANHSTFPETAYDLADVEDIERRLSLQPTSS